jgi:hypothetical protein
MVKTLALRLGTGDAWRDDQALEAKLRTATGVNVAELDLLAEDWLYLRVPTLDGMSTPTEFFRWWITDERTGKRRLTKFHMSAEDARDRYGDDAKPEPSTREERTPTCGSAAEILTKNAPASRRAEE